MLSFVALVSIAAVILGGVGWTGALAPRMGTDVGGVEQLGAWVALAEVTNHGPLEVHVQGASWESFGLSDVTIGLAAPGATLPATARPTWPGPRAEALPDDLAEGAVDRVVPFTLAPGESRVLVARGVPSCSVPSFDALRIEVRTRVGAHRTITAGGGPLSRGGSCP